MMRRSYIAVALICLVGGCSADDEPISPRRLSVAQRAEQCAGCATVVTAPPAGPPNTPSFVYSPQPYTPSNDGMPHALIIINPYWPKLTTGFVYVKQPDGSLTSAGELGSFLDFSFSASVSTPQLCVLRIPDTNFSGDAGQCWSAIAITPTTTTQQLRVYWNGGISNRAPDSRTSCTATSGQSLSLRFSCLRLKVLKAPPVRHFKIRTRSACMCVRG